MWYFCINLTKNIRNNIFSGVMYTKIKSLLKINQPTRAHYPLFPHRFRDIKEIKNEVRKRILHDFVFLVISSFRVKVSTPNSTGISETCQRIDVQSFSSIASVVWSEKRPQDIFFRIP
jgi:hypothetical protein